MATSIPATPQDGRSAPHQWGAVTLFHGLPSDHVRAIAQDADGVLWFGTDGGLARYDGRRTQKILDEGLPAGAVRVLHVDQDGILWAGSDTGAARYVRNKFNPIPETAGQTIAAIIAPEHGRVVLASEQGRVFTCVAAADGSVHTQSIGPKDSPLLSLAAGAPLPLTSLAERDDGLIIGTRGRGLLSMTGGVIKEMLSRPRPFFIGGIALDPSGQLWFGAETTKNDSGLYDARDFMRPQKAAGATGAVTSIRFGPQGDLWIGTAGQGAFRYRDPKQIAQFTFENTAGSLRSNFVYSVFVDREGVIWFGTDRGVCRYDPHSPQTETISNRPESNFLRALFQSPDGRWWSGTNRGLFVREPNRSDWQLVEETANRTIHAVAADSMGQVIVGTAGGLYAGSPFARVGSTDSVRAFANFRGATYLAGFGTGLEQFDGAQRNLVWPLETAEPREHEVVSLKTDGEDRLWIGTAAAGLFVFDGVRVTHDDEFNELNDTSIWDIERTSDNSLWLATSRGLYVYRSKTLAPVLTGTDARRIIADASGKAVWCATAGKGLFKILFDESEMVQAQINTEHGLPSDNIFTLVAAPSASGSEVLWLGTNRGLTRYEPGNIPPVLRATRILGQRPFQPEELSPGLHLEYPQKSLLVEMEAISSRTFPEQFLYEFTLTGDGGQPVTQRLSRDSQFLMDNLPPGDYRVVARAFNNDLTPSAPLKFEFSVARAPFPWTSAALSILLGLSLVTLSYGYRQNRKLKRTNAALAETRRQLANETENERRRIARDLHDQTLSDLRRLALLSDRLPAGNEVEPAVFRAEIESISTEIRHICEDLSPSVLANVGLAAALEWALSDMVAHLPAGQKPEYEFSCGEDLEERLGFDAAVQIQIYRIAQETISNICRHAAATRIQLAVQVVDGDFLLTLGDNGRGFDWTGKRTGSGRGLNNIRSRASLIDAQVRWRPNSGGGSTFTLRKKL